MVVGDIASADSDVIVRLILLYAALYGENKNSILPGIVCEIAPF